MAQSTTEVRIRPTRRTRFIMGIVDPVRSLPVGEGLTRALIGLERTRVCSHPIPLPVSEPRHWWPRCLAPRSAGAVHSGRSLAVSLFRDRRPHPLLHHAPEQLLGSVLNP